MQIGRICSVLRATSVALLATTASATALAPRAEAGQDWASLEILTTAADAQVQPVLDGKEAYIAGSPRSLTRAVRQLVTPFVWPNSTHYHDETLLPHIEEMLAVLTKVQHCDGTYTVGNYHSPPDTGFLIEDFGIMVRILEEDDHEDSQAFADTIRAILRKAATGLAKGGIHTPNHRWKVCAALARISRITDDESLIERIDGWLAEGIDIDADGIYSERSGIYYAAVSNPSLLTVARELNRTQLIEPVRKNLALSIEHAEPNCEIETVLSRRQDQNQYGSDNMHEFYPQFRELALLDGNGRFAAMARLLEARVPKQLGDYLANLIEQPELAKELPAPEKPFVDFQKLYPTASLVRVRNDKLTISAFGGTDWYHKGEQTEFYNRFGSGLSTNPSLLRAWNGNLVLEGIRMSANFFSMGHFRSNGIEFDDETGITKLGSTMEVQYYLPMPTDQLNKNGTYDLSRSVDGRFYASLDFENRPASVRRLKTDVTIVPTDAGYDLEFEVTGEKDVDITLEVTFREGGEFSGVEPSVDAEGNTIYHLKEGEGQYTNGKDTITFGPGNGNGIFNPDAGEQYSWHNGNLVLEGHHVYVTGTTPMKYTLNLGFS
ncbi:uncharacterized protein J7T54_001544 [Emericellopsis cladophorae]|uniref:Uncharacterized protein n=1 Tax=Emericellopsis cladophorae TaxID=2686198 RepID=A0A9P9XUJ0_9HYPO|nr:uncharacterized protein J7T54_001544 [Emericellopsis cladophorae]KAI6777780.1 hypothetical protein J7T54_001544 [Emericellopsis cladophorae]